VTILVFHASSGSAEIRLERSVEIKIVGGAISAGGPVLAFHTAGAWHVGSQRIDRIVCRGRVRVEFESKGHRRTIGPFDEFHLADDKAVGNQGVVARYQPLDQTWFFDRYDSETDGLVLREVTDLAAV
jgi:hypothetical protein